MGIERLQLGVEIGEAPRLELAQLSAHVRGVVIDHGERGGGRDGHKSRVAPIFHCRRHLRFAQRKRARHRRDVHGSVARRAKIKTVKIDLDVIALGVGHPLSDEPVVHRAKAVLLPTRRKVAKRHFFSPSSNLEKISTAEPPEFSGVGKNYDSISARKKKAEK